MKAELLLLWPDGTNTPIPLPESVVKLLEKNRPESVSVVLTRKSGSGQFWTYSQSEDEEGPGEIIEDTLRGRCCPDHGVGNCCYRG